MILKTRFIKKTSYIEERPYTIIELLILSGMTTSKAEAKRLVYQGQVKVNGTVYKKELLLNPIYIESIILLICRNQEVYFEKI